MEDKKYKVLVIDDEESMRDSCSLILIKEGFEVKTAENGAIGLTMLHEFNPDFKSNLFGFACAAHCLHSSNSSKYG